LVSSGVTEGMIVPFRGTAVMYYRAYVLNADGHITAVHELDCADDEQAQMLDGHDLEVWCRERKVALLKHQE
jgi:hypothetical protein